MQLQCVQILWSRLAVHTLRMQLVRQSEPIILAINIQSQLSYFDRYKDTFGDVMSFDWGRPAIARGRYS